jgi:hypothetical protein
MSDIKVIVARKDTDIYVNHLEVSAKRAKINNIFQVLDDKNSGKSETIFLKYNAGIQELINRGLKDDDIILFAHEDIALLDPFFREKIEMIFNEKKDIGVLGIAGTSELKEEGGWWNNDSGKLRGHLIQGKGQGVLGDGDHLIKGNIGYYDDLVAVDGAFLATTGKILNEGLRFDMNTFNTGNDMYDISFCFDAKRMGYKVVVADILIYHRSQGMGALTENWKINHDKMNNKIKSLGYKFPIVSSDFKLKTVNTNNVVEIEI